MAGRILHAGVTTSELLSMYINVIDAFKALDPRGVLLDKVAGPLRSYLRQRDDTVRIIAASFLADVDQTGNVTNPSDEVCSDLAREIQLSDGIEMKIDEKGLDWDDMTWVPDPIDAGPGQYHLTQAVLFMLNISRLQKIEERRCHVIHAHSVRTWRLYPRSAGAIRRTFAYRRVCDFGP